MNATTSVTERLLVALDGSRFAEQALSYVHALRSPSTDIVLVRVVPDSGAEEETQTAIEREAHLDLEQCAAAWGLPADRIALEVRTGDPATQILEVASDRQCTLVVIASHGRGAVGRWRFGSVADRVSRESTIPVLVMRPDSGAPPPGVPAPIERVIVPLDGSPRAETALPVASGLSRHLGVPMRLVRVAAPADTPLVPAAGTSIGGAPLYPAVMVQALPESDADHVSEAWTYLDAVARHPTLSGVPTTLDVLSGEPAHGLMDLATSSDLMVLTSRGRGGMTRWLLGSVAQKLLQHAAAPVCLVPSAPDSTPAPGA